MLNIKKLSVIIPVYGCIDTIDELYKRLNINLKKVAKNYEIIFVDDSNNLSTWNKLKNISKKSKKVLCISLSRNFGQHAAVTAGLENSNGDWIVIMDCDLQDKPEEIINLVKNCENDCDIVYASRKKRNDNFIKKISSILFYSLMSWLTNIKLDYTVSNFGLYKQKVIKAVLSLEDNHRFFPLLVRWVGFNSKTIVVKHEKRGKGRSGYSIRKLILLAFRTIISFSDKPLRIIMYIGFLIASVASIVAIYFLYLALNGYVSVIGWPSLIVSIWFFGGTLLGVIGLVGLYIGKTFDQTKKRPVYIIAKKINF